MGRLETHGSDSLVTNTGNSGRIGALMEYKIIDAEGNEIPRHEHGEICLRGPNIMLGSPQYH
jgi:fatty-acyl-CoA synthase